MATGGLTPLRGNNAQIGWFKQSAWGTGGLPTSWWVWRRGTSHSVVANDQTAREGDSGFSENLAWRQSLYGDVKVAETVRPRTIGCSLQAFMGSGSDTYTAPTLATTLAADVVAGATTVKLTADPGNIGTLAVNLTPGVASQTYEVVTLDLTTRTTPNYTVTIAAGGSTKFAHTSGDTVTSKSQHVFTRQRAAYDPYCVTVYRGDGSTAPFQAVQYIDTVCYDWGFRSGPSGAPLMAAHSWYARTPKLIAYGSPSPVLEGVGQVGKYSGGAFSHAMAAGTWSINGVTTGNAVTIESLAVQGRNTTNPAEYQTESLNPDYFTPDDCTLDIQMTLVFQTFQDYYNTYFGGVSTAGTVGSSIVGFGSFSVTYTEDAVNSLAISVPLGRYVAAALPDPDETATSIRQTISLRAMTNPSNTTPFTITLCNSQNSAY